MIQKDNAYWLSKEVDLSSVRIVQILVSDLTGPENQIRWPAVFTAKGIIDLPLDRTGFHNVGEAAHGERASARPTRRRMRLPRGVSKRSPRYMRILFSAVFVERELREG